MLYRCVTVRCACVCVDGCNFEYIAQALLRWKENGLKYNYLNISITCPHYYVHSSCVNNK